MRAPLRSAQLLVAADPAAAAHTAALVIATTAAQAIAQRGRAALAFSGGSTPDLMFRALASTEDLPVKVDWSKVVVAQVDERWAPDSDPARNSLQLTTLLAEPLGLSSEQLRLIRVGPAADGPDDIEAAALDYARQLYEIGSFDLVHLGLGDDGHTASLVPGDAVLAVDDTMTSTTQPYRGHRRVTLTFPVLQAARSLLWLVTGPSKANALPRLLAGDESIPAGRLAPGVVVCDRAALLGQ